MRQTKWDKLNLQQFNLASLADPFTEKEDHEALLQISPDKAPVDARWSHTKPKSPVRQARTTLDLNQDVPVNLIYKLTRKQQTVKFKSVSAGFPNHSYAGYRQGSTDTEDDDRSGMINV